MVWATFVDESHSNRALDPDTYILAAAIAAEEGLDDVRQQMTALQIGRGGKVHWRDGNAARQREIAETVSDTAAGARGGGSAPASAASRTSAAGDCAYGGCAVS